MCTHTRIRCICPIQAVAAFARTRGGFTRVLANAATPTKQLRKSVLAAVPGLASGVWWLDAALDGPGKKSKAVSSHRTPKSAAAPRYFYGVATHGNQACGFLPGSKVVAAGPRNGIMPTVTTGRMR